jgi:hypothetical protein
MNKAATLILSIGLILVPLLHASEVTGPLLGLAFDSAAAAFRPMRGIPGAATVGEASALDFIPAGTLASPAQFALAVRADDGGVMMIRSKGDALSSDLLAGARNAPDLIAFSDEGTTAALYFAGAGRIQVFGGLPDSPRLLREADVSGLTARLGRIAVNPVNSALLAAAGEGDSQALYMISANEDARRLGSFGAISALVFAAGGTEALIADAQANAVYRLSTSTGEIVTIASEKDGLLHPVALASAPGGRVMIADDKSGAVLVIDGGPPAAIQCGCTPTGLSRLSGASVFRLSDPADGPVWILDTGGAEPRVLAVPAMAGAGGRE